MMRVWEGENVDSNDREAALSRYVEEEIDPEFVPYLREINSLPFVVSAQCCIGHMGYERFQDTPQYLPEERTSAWGYLQLMVTFAAAEWISEQAAWNWLWYAGSQLFVEGCGSPETTDNGSFFIAFAWDAITWPTPALDIIELLNEFYEQGCIDE